MDIHLWLKLFLPVIVNNWDFPPMYRECTPGFVHCKVWIHQHLELHEGSAMLRPPHFGIHSKTQWKSWYDRQNRYNSWQLRYHTISHIQTTFTNLLAVLTDIYSIFIYIYTYCTCVFKAQLQSSNITYVEFQTLCSPFACLQPYTFHPRV